LDDEPLLKAGFTTSFFKGFEAFVTAGLGETPKALTLAAEIRRRLRSFMMI